MITTRYGNSYSHQEWAEMKAQFKAEEERDNEIEAKIDKMVNYLKRQCREVGFTQSQVDTIAQLFRSGDWAEANIQFSSKEKENFLNDLWKRFDEAMRTTNE